MGSPVQQAVAAEYRVVWQREGRVQQVRRYAKERGAQMRYALLTSSTPWTLLGYAANDYVCCRGRIDECGCEGETFAEKTKRINAETPLKFVRIESRSIGEWKPVTVKE